MLDEPPLIVRMHGLTGFMDDSFVILRTTIVEGDWRYD
jgi:hypothetical protein